MQYEGYNKEVDIVFVCIYLLGEGALQTAWVVPKWWDTNNNTAPNKNKKSNC